MAEYGPAPYDYATITAVLRGDSHSTADLSFLVSALDGLVTSSVLALALSAPEIEDYGRVRDIVLSQGFDSQSMRLVFGLPTARQDDFSPLDPKVASARDATASLVRRSIYQEDIALYRRVFGIAEVARAEHNSPLLLELGLAIGVVTVVPVVLVVGAARAAISLRRAAAEADIRETEAKIRREELQQKQIQTLLLRRTNEVAQELQVRDYPKEAITEASRLTTTAVADLGGSPLIGNLTVGFSSKAG